MKESTIQRQVKQHLEQYDWYVANLHGNQFQPGLPDLLCCHPVHGIKLVEIKREDGRLTQAQRVVFERLDQAGAAPYVLTRADSCECVLLGEPNWREWVREKRVPGDLGGWLEKRFG